MQQIASQRLHLHALIQFHLLMHQRIVVAGQPGWIEAQHAIRIPAAMADVSAKDPVQAWYRIDDASDGGRTDTQDLGL